MKKLMVLAASLVLMVTCALFAACGGIEGTYKFYSLQAGDQTIYAGGMIDGVTLDADSMVITIKADGTCIMTEKGDGEVFEMNGTWVNKEGNVYTLSYIEDGEEVDACECTIDGNTLTMTMMGEIYTLKK